jgi:NAD dependent epimerase/dehydratase family enzyme
MSWIALDDVLAVILRALTDDSLAGPVNAVAPNAVTNREFTRTLGRVLMRPTIFPVPAFALRTIFGEMADETLLASNRVQPAKLLTHGFVFNYPELEGALRHVLGK